ncbi:hypothetical protein ECED1_1120 [Escherichia coli ED1a]|uniref:Uncharacterized protein n=1 Tax=Escherichia coli O81 (strain ED1a) TaxID=585397 RepID=B7MPX5_ECO81|nr:hypothetical protein ECED1_1120 [Escherichia coli ED1a]DAH41809.1 MAG TPA: hypothetical protein [Caudoviricetes sp.]
MPRYSQFRLAIIVWPAGSLLKKYGMVNPLCGGAYQRQVFGHTPYPFWCGFRC